MAIIKSTITKLLRDIGFPDIPRPKDLVGRVNVISNTLNKIRSLGEPLPTLKKTIAAFRQLNFGVSDTSFSTLYKQFKDMAPEIATQRSLNWDEKIPSSLIPESDYELSTKYVYKYRVDVFDKATGQWSNQWVSMGSDRKLTANQAWQEFTDNFVDTQPGGINTYYKMEINTDSATFEGVWQSFE